jgi:predicted methyltransferase
VDERHANNRLPNVVRVDADLPAASAVPPGSVDVAITALNFHDVYNRDPALAEMFMKGVYTMLKPGGVFGVIDHVGVEGANNTQLHRVPKQKALDAAKAAGFVVEAESDMLAHPEDDHTRGVFDAGLRGKTDQFVLKLRKAK